MEPPLDLAARLNRIEWRNPQTVSPEAETLIQDYLRRIRNVINFLVTTRGLNPSEAYAVAQAGGHASARYEALLKTLFTDVAFRGVGGVREALILTIASAWSWELDPELGKLENPWKPLVKVYELGYTSTFEEGPEAKTIDLVIGLRDGEKTYKII
jgi:hypothetical protein